MNLSQLPDKPVKRTAKARPGKAAATLRALRVAAYAVAGPIAWIPATRFPERL